MTIKRFEDPPQFRPPVVEQAEGVFVLDEAWARWFISISAALSAGYNGTVPLTKLTGGGTDGSLTYTYGIVTSVVLPT